VACWSTKAAISLKGVKIEEILLWTAYRKSQTLFRTVPSPTLYGLPFPKIGGSQSQPTTALAIISGTAKDRLQIWPIHSSGPSEHKPMKKFWRKGSVGVSRDYPNFWSIPYYLRNG